MTVVIILITIFYVMSLIDVIVTYMEDNVSGRFAAFSIIITTILYGLGTWLLINYLA